MGIAEENIGAGEGAREGFRLSTRGSTSAALEAYAACVSGPSNIVSAREYVLDDGREKSRLVGVCRSEYDRCTWGLKLFVEGLLCGSATEVARFRLF